jgi:hypothetical protein
MQKPATTAAVWADVLLDSIAILQLILYLLLCTVYTVSHNVIDLGIVNAAIRVCVHLQFLLTLSSTWMVLTHCSNGCIVKLGTFHCLQDNEQQEKACTVRSLT